MGKGLKTTPIATASQKPSPLNPLYYYRCFRTAVEILFVAFFFEMLIAGAYLHLSWKLLMMFFFVIAVPLFVPRRIHKYIALLVLAGLTCITVWTLNSDGDISWRPTRFDDDFYALSSDTNLEGENAADIYNKLLDEYDGLTFHPNIWDLDELGLSFTSIFPTELYPDIAEMIKSKEGIIDDLLKAAKIENCRFPVPADMNEIRDQQHRIAVMKIWARLLLNSSNNDLGDGLIETALEKQFAVLKMADHLFQQRTMFDNSGAIYIQLMAAENINSFIVRHCTDETYLDLIASKLKLRDDVFPNNWPYIYNSLKLVVKNTVGLLYETHPDGRTRRSQSIAPTLNDHFSAKMHINAYQMSVVKAGAVGHWFILPATPAAAGKIIDDAFEEYSPTVNSQQLQNGKPKFRLNYEYVCRQCAYYCAKFYYAIQTQSRRSENAARSTRILIELKRYFLTNGDWPDSINNLPALPSLALKDTVNDLEFVYKPADDSFLLYSIGRNKRDDYSYSIPRLHFDDIRYWPEELPEP